MSGGVRQAWQWLRDEVWRPLAEYSSEEEGAPDDLFGDLFAAAEDYLSPGPTPSAMEEARNDPARARELFLAISGVDFGSESAAVLFKEEADRVIAEYEMPRLTDLYRRLVRAALRKLNLRYRLEEPFRLRFLLPGSFANLYEELERINRGNPHLESLLGDFEKSFDHYARTQDVTDLKTCISKASNYAEGLASATSGTTGPLGALCDRLTDWPHDKLKDALKNVYHFCCDYPGVRHGGTPANARRDLASRDVTLASLLLLSFAGYLSPALDEKVVLGV